MPASVLVLRCSDAFGAAIDEALEDADVQVRHADLASQLDQHLGSSLDLVIVDFGAGSSDLLARLRAFRGRAANCAVLAVADPSGASTAVEGLSGAIDDYVLSPPNPGEIAARAQRVLASRDLHRRLDLLQIELNRRYGAHRIACRSNAMEAVYLRVLQLALTRTTVLITGESGAGKELIARSLHYNGDRRDQPFIALNCAAVTETLIESEMFGHQRGAFTGAVETVAGKFELAHGGTLFLDEVGSMGLSTQARLLRVLEEGEFMRVGGKKTLKVDVRLVAATNTHLEEQVHRGEFRKDLLYRLKVATIDVPPLRRRRDDIPVLARMFVRQLCEENGLPAKELALETVRVLSAHDWPGNVRELKNLLESLVVTVPERVIGPEHLPEALRPGDGPPAGAPSVGMTLAQAERRLIADTLVTLRGNRTRAAKMLGIGVRTLQRKLKEFRIDVPYQPDPP